MAEWSIEQGLDELAAHNAGECEGMCPYCDEEIRKAKPRRRRSRKCKTCGGRGVIAHDPTREPCSDCGGRGRISS